MRFGPGLVLIAVGAILRFGITTSSTHGISIHTIGDILMLVGVLGVALALLLWAPWARGRRRVTYRDEVPPGAVRPVTYREEVPPGTVPPPNRYPAERTYQEEYRYEDDYPR